MSLPCDKQLLLQRVDHKFALEWQGCHGLEKPGNVLELLEKLKVLSIVWLQRVRTLEWALSAGCYFCVKYSCHAMKYILHFEAIPGEYHAQFVYTVCSSKPESVQTCQMKFDLWLRLPCLYIETLNQSYKK
jgi:hypothetical protein